MSLNENEYVTKLYTMKEEELSDEMMECVNQLLSLNESSKMYVSMKERIDAINKVQQLNKLMGI